MTHRADTNQFEIIGYIQTIPGVSYKITSQTDNFVDLVVGWRGVNYLWEIKTLKGKLSKSQKQFHQSWSGTITVIRTIDDVNRALGIAE